MTNGTPEIDPIDIYSNEAAPHFAAIGRVAEEWAWFEMWVDTKTLELAGIPFERGVCLTAQISGSARKLNAYIATARYLGAQETAIKQLNKFAKETTGLAERRNRIVHDPWLWEKGSVPSMLEVTAQKVLRYHVVPVPTESIDKLARSIMEHTSNFDALHKKIVTEIAAKLTPSR
jgi:hypothetical protein